MVLQAKLKCPTIRSITTVLQQFSHPQPSLLFSLEKLRKKLIITWCTSLLSALAQLRCVVLFRGLGIQVLESVEPVVRVWTAVLQMCVALLSTVRDVTGLFQHYLILAMISLYSGIKACVMSGSSSKMQWLRYRGWRQGIPLEAKLAKSIFSGVFSISTKKCVTPSTFEYGGLGVI